MEPLKNEYLLINETFYSVQGEGFHTGKPAFFIRFSGCDIGCKWCDSKDAWDPENSIKRTVKSLIEEANLNLCETVVITGGEPLMQDISNLTKSLIDSGKKVHLETSGSYALPEYYDWLTLSPKRLFPPLIENFSKANELKIIVNEIADFDFCNKNQQLVNPDCHLFLQPQWSNKDKIIHEIIRYLATHPEWRLSLQVHKYLGIN